MTDITGKINFVNQNAQYLFKLSKKEFLNRYINGKNWNITDINNDPIEIGESILDTIKKTFETVKNVKYYMETGEKYKILVLVSGSPIFDVKGNFVGVVFSLEDITKHQELEDEVEKYKQNENGNLIGQKIEESIEKMKISTSNEQFNLLQVAMTDISANLRNMISEAVLLTNSFQNDLNEEFKNGLIAELNGILLKMNSSLGDSLKFYNDLYLYKKINFSNLLNRGLNQFIYSFEQKDIIIENNIDENIGIDINPKDGIVFIFRLIETILSLEIHFCKIELNNNILILNVDNKDYNKEIFNQFIENYEEKRVSNLFNEKILNIEIKS